MRKTIDLTKTWLTYNYESENEECGDIELELNGTEKTAADLYDWLIDWEMGNMKDFGYEDIKHAEYEEDTILFKKENEEGEWEECWITIKIYAKDEDEEDEWVYIPYSYDPITAVEV